MEKRSILSINEYEIECNLEMTKYLLHLFERDDLYKTEVAYDDEMDLVEIGLKNTSFSCLYNLKQNGYTHEYFLNRYIEYRQEVLNTFIEQIDLFDLSQDKIDKILNHIKSESVIKEFEYGMKLFKDADFTPYLIDFESIGDYLKEHLNDLPYEVILPLSFFSPNFYQKYDFLVLMMFIYFLLESIDEEMSVRLDLTDFISNEDELNMFAIYLNS